jgi:shikimate dehydrogenase
MSFDGHIYGLIGYPLSHSFSKSYFTEKFLRENILECQYDLFPIPSIASLPELLQAHPNLRGLNVTIPYKEQVLAFLHQRSPAVLEIGACNCIHIHNGKLTGHNTDVIGFEQMVLPYLKPHHTDALILGKGGAAKAVGWVLAKRGIRHTYVSRTAQAPHITYESINNAWLQQYTLIINTTPLGMSPHINECPDIPYEAITDRHLCVDLIYNPARTLFLEKAAAQGAAILNGKEMLVIQAEESWKIWNEK